MDRCRLVLVLLTPISFLYAMPDRTSVEGNGIGNKNFISVEKGVSKSTDLNPIEQKTYRQNTPQTTAVTTIASRESLQWRRNQRAKSYSSPSIKDTNNDRDRDRDRDTYMRGYNQGYDQGYNNRRNEQDDFKPVAPKNNKVRAAGRPVK